MQSETANLLQRAIALATSAHEGQTRRNGDPYILHPLRVMFRVEDNLARVLAVLHDVVEDTPVTLESLRQEGFPEQVLSALALLTHADGVPYEDYVQAIAADPLARQVKLADLEDNLNASELPEIGDTDLARIAKYHRAWRRLRRDPGGQPR